ncbi:MAG: NAD(P)/FAD-dependent oxidoreductase [Planctomycetes bacterium]|jgi:uncharacterized FAD-dependent dehydrogenase|nr:NAD(P)/FAD-dependent oxidoreductase [Planctomycetota bacterium]MCL4731318.1 NAD(P)/FAD-dependent oxidoreductase [Planctomycetota bacterium]
MATLRLYNLAVSLDDDFARGLAREAERRVGAKPAAVRLVKRGVDARGRVPYFNCTADVELPSDADAGALARRIGTNAAIPEAAPPLTAEPGREPLRGPVVVVGSGPAGTFAAWVLALNGYRPLVFERGKPAPERLRQIGRFNARVVGLDPENNTLFGEGGAGSFSDGKLYTSNRDPLIPRVLEFFVQCGAPPEVMTDAAPHVGTDILSRVVVRMRETITNLGGAYRFDARLSDLRVENGTVTAVTLNSREIIETGTVILAPGHSARDTYEMLLARGVATEPKPFQLGVRIEHPQGFIDRAQLGRFARDRRLVPASYDLACRVPGAPELYSFCMCPGGITLASISEPGHLCTNGMSFSPQASGFANSALVTTFYPGDFGTGPLDGVNFQRRFESAAFAAGGGDYTCPAQPVTHYLRGLNSPRNMRSTYARGRRYTPLAELLPEKLNRALFAGLPQFDRRIRGFVSDSGILHAVESRASSPVRLGRDPQTRQSTSVRGLYPCGEGAGFAGGIVSAALDGMRGALALIARHARPA